MKYFVIYCVIAALCLRAYTGSIPDPEAIADSVYVARMEDYVRKAKLGDRQAAKEFHLIRRNHVVEELREEKQSRIVIVGAMLIIGGIFVIFVVTRESL